MPSSLQDSLQRATQDATKALIPVSVWWCIIAVLLSLGVVIRAWVLSKEYKKTPHISRTTLIQDIILTLVWALFVVETGLAFLLLRRIRDLSHVSGQNILELGLAYVPRFIKLLRTSYIVFLVNIVCLWLSKTPLFVLVRNRFSTPQNQTVKHFLNRITRST